jgi:hypothetical protein
MSLQFAKNPIITLTEKSDPKMLLNNGIIGWILVTTTDIGPAVKIVSEHSESLYNLSEKDLTLFAVGSISIVGIGGNFVENRYIIPFKSDNYNLSAICVSFTIKDHTLKDPRKDQTSEAVFAILVPNIIINYLGNVTKESFSVIGKINESETIQDFIEKTDFAVETLSTIRNLLLEKIS